jgi:hypothetical protein
MVPGTFFCLTEEQAVRRQGKQKRVQKKKGKALASRTLQKQAYNFLLTNIPQKEISIQDLYQLYSLRWQVKILFKTWKSHFHLDKVKIMKKERFECHLYDTLIAIWRSIRFAFQARLFLYKKQNIELSQYKAMGIIREFLPKMIQSETDLIQLIHQVHMILKRHSKKSCKKWKSTTLNILIKIGIL